MSKHSGWLLYSRKNSSLKKSLRINKLRTDSTRVGVLLNYTIYDKHKPFSGLIKFSNGSYTNAIIPHGLLPGSFIKTENLPTRIVTNYNIGDCVLLVWLPKKSIFFNLINVNRKVSHVSRSAGTYCTLLDFEMSREFARIKIPSGLVLIVYSLHFVTLGRNSNVFVKKLVFGKAGLKRTLGFRSSVRGVAKNPVDHPHGGRTKTNSPERTPWGMIAKKNK